jgi:hypothetical protein
MPYPEFGDSFFLQASGVGCLAKAIWSGVKKAAE